MARIATPGLLDHLIECATRVFIRKGYRGTRIEDVSLAAERSVGTVYRHFENKDALFELVIRRAFHDPTADEVETPYKARHTNDTIEQIWQHLTASDPVPSLRKAVGQPAPDDVWSELESIVRELYRWHLKHWKAVKLVERCARDWPELAALFYKQHRRGLLELGATYVERRTSEGVFNPMPDNRVAARLLGENIAFFAMHRHTAPDSDMPDALAEETLVAAMCHAFARPGTT